MPSAPFVPNFDASRPVQDLIYETDACVAAASDRAAKLAVLRDYYLKRTAYHTLGLMMGDHDGCVVNLDKPFDGHAVTE